MVNISELQMFMAMKSGMFPLEVARHSFDSTKKYASFGDKEGNFYIMEITGDVDDMASFRYKFFSAPTPYETVWAIRETITYDYPWNMII